VQKEGNPFMSNKELNAITKFIEHFTKVTVRIASYDGGGHMITRCSGFLYQPGPDLIPVVLTAGHKLPIKGSLIETRIQKDGHILAVNAGEFKIFYNHDTIDYAYSYLPNDVYDREMKPSQGIELSIYQHKFLNPERNDAYGFAVVNDYAEFIKADDTYLLPSYCCFEVGMELIDQTEHINYFKVARSFQGDEYYKGASGAPIANPEGVINSILIGGCQQMGVLKAFRLDNAVIELK
jgi:hypothetical protein